MSKRIMIGMLGLLAFAFGSNARADWLTTPATLDAAAPQQAGSPPIPDIRQISGSGGALYTNTYGFNGSGQALIRTVFALPLVTATDGGTFVPLSDGHGHQIIAIGAVDGVVTSSSSTGFTALFTAGMLGITENVSSSSLFNKRDPTTWGFGTAAASNIVSQWSLVNPADTVRAGDGQPIPAFAANVVNTSSVNSTAGQQTDGRFLLQESSSPSQNPGNNFLNLTDPGFLAEGIFAEIHQTLDNKSTGSIGTNANDANHAFGSSQLTALNQIATWAGLSSLDGVPADQKGFATAYGPAGTGTTTAWDPEFDSSGKNLTGDFRASLNAEADPVGLVPEPSSVVLFGLGAAVAGIWFGIRRGKRFALAPY